MKKIIILIIAMMVEAVAFAQCYDIYYNTALRGGYNLLAKQPTADVSVTCDINVIRTKIEIGMGILPAVADRQMSRFVYVSPSLGIAFGGRNVYYLLAGATPWRKYASPYENSIISDVWHFKTEAGVEFRISDLLFWNVEAAYMVLHGKSDGECPYLALKTGIGFNF